MTQRKNKTHPIKIPIQKKEKEDPSNTYNEEDNFLFNLIKESLLEEKEKDKEKEKPKEKDKNTILNKLPNLESGFFIIIFGQITKW
jgi:hypothetical protein